MQIYKKYLKKPNYFKKKICLRTKKEFIGIIEKIIYDLNNQIFPSWQYD